MLSKQLSADPEAVAKSRFDDSEDGDSDEQDGETEPPVVQTCVSPKARESLLDMVIGYNVRVKTFIKSKYFLNPRWLKFGS